MRLWEVDSGRLRDVFTGHTDRIWCVTFWPDGRRLASAAVTARSNSGTWSIASTGRSSIRREPCRLLSDSHPTARSSSSNAGMVCSRHTPWQAGPPTVRGFVSSGGDFAGLSFDGRIVARGSGFYRVFIDEIRMVEHLEIAIGVSYGSHSLTFSPDGNFLLLPDYMSHSLRVFATPLRDRTGHGGGIVRVGASRSRP